MATAEPGVLRDPLDPLRRFIETPLRMRFLVDGIQVLAHTNDFTLLPALPLYSAPDEVSQPRLEWKLVRDPDAQGFLEEPLLLRRGPVAFAILGPACLVAVDGERRELLGFIGKDIDARTFQERLVPFFCRLMSEAAGACTEALRFPEESSIDV